MIIIDDYSKSWMSPLEAYRRYEEQRIIDQGSGLIEASTIGAREAAKVRNIPAVILHGVAAAKACACISNILNDRKQRGVVDLSSLADAGLPLGGRQC